MNPTEIQDSLRATGLDTLRSRYLHATTGGGMLRGLTVLDVRQIGRKRPTFTAHLSDGRELALHFLIATKALEA